MPEYSTYHELIASDKEIVKAILRLTGSVEGIKTQVNDYMQAFNRYEFLWKEDLQAAYDAFIQTSPGIEAFEVRGLPFLSVCFRFCNQWDALPLKCCCGKYHGHATMMY